MKLRLCPADCQCKPTKSISTREQILDHEKKLTTTIVGSQSYLDERSKQLCICLQGAETFSLEMQITISRYLTGANIMSGISNRKVKLAQTHGMVLLKRFF